MVRRPLIAAFLCAAIGAVVYLLAMNVPAVRDADLRTLEGFMGLATVTSARYADLLVSLFDPLPFALITFGLVTTAVLAGRARAGLVAFAVIAAASVTTQLLKPALATPRASPADHYMSPASWPSGHTTAVMSLALALVIISPMRLRPLAAAAGGLLTVGTVYSILILHSHYPSDVIGGFLVATGWASLGTMALRPEGRPSLRALVSGPALAAAVLAGGGALAVALRPDAAFAYASANTTFVAGALAIAAGALVLSGSVLVPTRAQRHPQPGSPRARG
jgi:membrane-associated phospholipid phosphatase